MSYEQMPERIVQELVPGKEITIAHLIASPDITLYEKLGLDPRVEYSKSAIGVLTISPAETAIIAADIAINVLNIIFAFCVLVLTTKPSDIIESMVSRGFSPRIGYVFVSLFQLIPQMTERMSTITDAQRSRGMETEGSLLIRMKAFIPLISPVIMSSFIDTKERAIALEVRGFNSKEKKSFLNVFHANAASRPIYWILLIATVASVVWKLVMMFA